ncbi:hypothetical protein SEUCBS140593_007825 [Sporothrix eucalyptigena]|uniref:PLAC8 family protein n=1 Tax=Sporothrix eucalyptigena TaxID=1812306 RepID=A0ABP0CGG9_9PEZI
MAVNDKDVAEWTERFKQVLATPAEHINQRSPEGAQSWSEAFFGCCSPIDLCLVTYCLPCVTFGKTHHRLRKDATLEGYEPINTSCLLLCGSACCGLHWIPMALQRADIRTKYNLEGNCIVDIAASCCCALCVLTQDEKEVKARDAAGQGNGGVKQQYQAAGNMTYPGAAPAAPAASAASAPQ